MIRVVLSGIFYPMAILRYFEAALKRRGDVDLRMVGPFTETWIPWGGGMHLPSKYAVAPDIQLPTRKGFQIAAVEASLGDWEPDVWIQVDADYHLTGKPKRGVNCIVATDPHVIDYNQQRGYADHFFCMQKVYMHEGDHYLPYAYDPVYHRPSAQDIEFDLVFLGIPYEQRNEVVQQLSDLKVFYTIGYAFDEARELYGKARTSFNSPSLLDLNARYFELAAMQVPATVGVVPDIDLFFSENEHFLYHDSPAGAARNVRRLLDDYGEAEKMARRAREAVEGETYDARVEHILEVALCE